VTKSKERGQLLDLVDPAVAVERLATGFRFIEGPIWNANEESLLFNDIPGDVALRWNSRTGVDEVRRPSNKANGMVYDRERNLLICEHITSAVVRERPNGEREVLASHYQGQELNSPNDVITTARGDIYFTDPWYGRMPVFGEERARDLPFQGVYRIAAGSRAVHLVAHPDEFAMPNGLCLSPDESLMYVNDTVRAHIKVFNVSPQGSLVNGRIFLSGIGGRSNGESAPDGMKCDERGNVWVTGPGGVWVISQRGEHLGTVHVPEIVGNLTWGGPAWRTLYLASSTSLYRLETKVASARLPYHD
jgi:gluconolactonase